MLTVFIVIHLLVAVSLIGLILLQKSEGNSAGGGFSVSSMTSMMQPRARPNPLSRATTVLGIGFFVTSLGLALLAKNLGPAPSLLATMPGGVSSTRTPRVDEVRTPSADAPAAPAAAAPDTAAPQTPAAPPAVPTVPKN